MISGNKQQNDIAKRGAMRPAPLLVTCAGPVGMLYAVYRLVHSRSVFRFCVGIKRCSG